MVEKYRLRSSVILKSEENLFLCYDAEEGIIMELNPSAFSILEHCKRQRSIAEIVGFFIKNFRETPSREKIKKDVSEIVEYFKKRKILKNG